MEYEYFLIIGYLFDLQAQDLVLFVLFGFHLDSNWIRGKLRFSIHRTHLKQKSVTIQLEKKDIFRVLVLLRMRKKYHNVFTDIFCERFEIRTRHILAW